MTDWKISLQTMNETRISYKCLIAAALIVGDFAFLYFLGLGVCCCGRRKAKKLQFITLGISQGLSDCKKQKHLN